MCGVCVCVCECYMFTMEGGGRGARENSEEFKIAIS